MSVANPAHQFNPSQMENFMVPAGNTSGAKMYPHERLADKSRVD